MVIKWFDARDVEEFSKELAKFFIQRIPLDVEKKNIKGLEKQFKTVNKMYLQIDQFKLKNKLNIYKKAKLGSTFKYELIDAGYPPEFVDEVIKGLIQKL